MSWWWWAQVTQTTDSLAQWGPLGVFVVLLSAAIVAMFRQQSKSQEVERQVAAKALEAAQKALELERARSDGYRDELAKLNAVVQDRYMTTLMAATEAIRDGIALRRGHQ